MLGTITVTEIIPKPVINSSDEAVGQPLREGVRKAKTIMCRCVGSSDDGILEGLEWANALLDGVQYIC